MPDAMLKSRKPTPPGQLPAQEELLADLARSLRIHRKGRRAIHLHLSRLSRYRLHAHDLRQAVEALGPLVRKFEGRLFRLANHDIILVAKGLSFAALDEAVLKVRHLFRDDPAYRLLDSGVRSAAGTDDFCTFYDLEQEADAFLACADRMLDSLPDADDIDPAVVSFAALPLVNSYPLPPLRSAPREDASALARNISPATVSALSRDGLATPILTELHVRVDSLRVMVRSGRTLPNDRWLLRALSDHLDEKIIAELITTSPLPTAFSLPVLVETVDSTEFQDFTKAYRQLTRGSVVFEFTAQDFLRDPARFLAARDRIIGLGHKLCLSSWNPHLFAMMNPSLLEIHFHKISWTPLLIGGIRSDWGAALRESVRRTGATKVLLSDCSSPEALAFGQRYGLLLFQGPQIEATTRV
ncbi:hypothetical protein [Govanella unica]|uniref:EAL domain-containing protein n=1 Tax=Govanella unica TaxID=2975056 RepID=A0A9X3TZ83_9PROT|nr:hypothetical protein [Govania unica]MDA5194489.1 hypothetical protein [Govania unica]